MAVLTTEERNQAFGQLQVDCNVTDVGCTRRTIYKIKDKYQTNHTLKDRLRRTPASR